MSTGVDQHQQRSNAKGQAISELNKNSNADMNYVPQHQMAYTTQTTDGVTTDPYGLMQGYYPYYTMTTDDMTPGTMWSTGYNPVDYTSMMADYSYSGYGWLPHGARVGAGGPGGWDTALKDDGSNCAPYASAGGYYTADLMSMYGAQNLSNGQDHGNPMNSLEQGLQSVTLDDSNVAGSNAKQSVSNGRPSGGSKSWATVASQPAHSQMYAASRSRPTLMPRSALGGGGGGGPTGGWDLPRHPAAGGDSGRQAHEGWMASRRRPTASGSNSTGTGVPLPAASASLNSTDVDSGADSSGIQYNPKEFDLSPKAARFFIIKSYAEDDIHRSIKYRIWCSTEYGNKRLDAAYRERQGKGPVYLFYSVNGSGHFCGVAQMMSPVDYQSSSDVWAQDKWKGKFEVKWIYIKDVPNSQLRHIRLENNEGKPVTNSRDTQEVPADKGCQVLRVIHQYRHTTSIFDDFAHYESRQNEKNVSKQA